MQSLVNIVNKTAELLKFVRRVAQFALRLSVLVKAGGSKSASGYDVKWDSPHWQPSEVEEMRAVAEYSVSICTPIINVLPESSVVCKIYNETQ